VFVRPLTSDSTRPGGAQRTAASISPVAELLLTSTGRVVRKTCCSPCWMRANIASKAAPRCAIIGCSMASSTSRRTSVGPGRKKVPE